MEPGLKWEMTSSLALFTTTTTPHHCRLRVTHSTRLRHACCTRHTAHHPAWGESKASQVTGGIMSLMYVFVVYSISVVTWCAGARVQAYNSERQQAEGGA